MFGLAKLHEIDKNTFNVLIITMKSIKTKFFWYSANYHFALGL